MDKCYIRHVAVCNTEGIKCYIRHVAVCNTEDKRPSTSEENIQMQSLQKFVIPPLIHTLLSLLNCFILHTPQWEICFVL